MNGPPGDGKAAGMLGTPATAEREAQSSDSIGDDDESRKFIELQQRADSRGYSLRATHSGFVLQRGNYSLHSGDLMAVFHALARMGKQR